MKITHLSLALLFAPALAHAQSISSDDVQQNVASAVSMYASSISCGDVEVTLDDIATLSPYTSWEDRESAAFAVLWHGDIGCLGGSGTTTTNIAIVNVRTGDSYVVDPAQSSPAVDVSYSGLGGRIVQSTQNSIVLETSEHAPGDANCCPSITKTVQLRRDSRGNWVAID